MTVRDFLLPDLGEGLEDAEIVTWRVAQGQVVELNQVLVEVNTAKAMVEIPSPWAGVVERLHGSEGDMVKVGAPLVSIRVEEEAPKRRAVLVGYGVDEGGDAPSAPRRRFRTLNRAPGSGPEASAESSPVAESPVAEVRATPPIRRLAKDLGVDLSKVTATGENGRVTRDDVQRAASREPGEQADTRIPVTGVRRLIAEKMARSVSQIPHVTTFLTLDATNLAAFRELVETQTGERVSPLPIVVRALTEIVREHPKLNASFDTAASEIVLHGRIHVGIATDTEQGLMVPVIRDADSLGILDLAHEIARLSQAVRAGTAKPDEVTGSTITVTNVGTFGAEFGTPIINHPEAAILALGVIEPRALVVDGRVEARQATTLSLSFDHRLLDGAEAGRALKDLSDLLENPFKLGALPLGGPRL